MALISKPLTPEWDLLVLKMLVTLVLFTLWLELLRSLPISNFLSLLLAALRFCNPGNLHSLVADFQILTSALCCFQSGPLTMVTCSPWICLFSLDLDMEVMGKLSSCHSVGGPFLFSGPVTSQFLSEWVCFPGSTTICPPYGMK